MMIGEPEEAPSLKTCAIRCLGEPRCKAVGFGVSAGKEGSPSPERLSMLSDGRRKGSCALLRLASVYIHEQYQQFIRKLAVKLFRRPVNDNELTRFFDVAKKRYETDENVLDAVQSALTMMLCSPKFLYKYEGDSLNLDDYAIASRLSYFLWNTLPDDRLIKLASEGSLTFACPMDRA